MGFCVLMRQLMIHSIAFANKTAYPDVQVHELNEDWEFILLASDGIWDVLSNEDVVQLVLQKIAAGTAPETICEELMTECLSPDLLMTGKILSRPLSTSFPTGIAV